jgi:hypothetical protein
MTIAVAGTANQRVVCGASAEWENATPSALPSAVTRTRASNPHRRTGDESLLTPVNVLQSPATRLLRR